MSELKDILDVIEKYVPEDKHSIAIQQINILLLDAGLAPENLHACVLRPEKDIIQILRIEIMNQKESMNSEYIAGEFNRVY